MPQNRFLHPALGHSEKVNALTDLEFRVWVQYLLSADDYGVMRCSAVTVQAGNHALAQRSPKAIMRAIERLIDVGLVVPFTHQTARFICQLDWHKWQRFNLPSKTGNPAPPIEILDRCDPGTFALFAQHYPTLVSVDLTIRVEAASTAEFAQPLSTANGLRRTANGLEERFIDFWRVYPRRVGKDAARKAWARLKPSAELVATMLAALDWQRQQDGWLKDGGAYIPHPATWLNQGRWQDEPTHAPQIAAGTLKTARAVEEFIRS